MENTEPNGLSISNPRIVLPDCINVVGSPKYSVDVDGLCSQVVQYYYTLEKDEDTLPDVPGSTYTKIWWKRTIRTVREEDDSTTRSGRAFRPLTTSDETVRLSPDAVQLLFGVPSVVPSPLSECRSSER